VAQETTELLTASSAPHSLRVHYIQAAASPVTVVTGSIIADTANAARKVQHEHGGTELQRGFCNEDEQNSLCRTWNREGLNDYGTANHANYGYRNSPR
jgi:hypothetical protein